MGSAGDRYFIAMRYILGRSLDKALREDGPLPWAEVLRLAEQIGGALAFAHERGFLHRDVKPANIIRTPEGAYVLTDFGLTRAMMATGLTSHTGAALGTPAYIPPEIWLGEKATPATDEYALACVLVEALTGDVLFAGDTPPAVMTRHVLKGAELPEAWAEGVPEDAGVIFARALSKAPGERYGGPGALVQTLHDLLLKKQQRKAEEAARQQREAEEIAHQQREAEEAARKRLEVAPQLPAANIKSPSASEELILTLAPGVEMVFVRIPAGEFLMGENPPQPVHVDEYWIGKYPVTNAQYAAFVRAGDNRYVPKYWEHGHIPSGKEAHPVVYVSLHDAKAFCEWVTQVTGQTVQVPTEAQWEKAARGTDGRTYPWGEDAPTRRHCTFAAEGTTPVGAHSPVGDSPYGCADMAGNVWEWCVGSILRGGSWYNKEAEVCRCGFRNWSIPWLRLNSWGFRCVRISPQSP